MAMQWIELLAWFDHALAIEQARASALRSAVPRIEFKRR